MLNFCKFVALLAFLVSSVASAADVSLVSGLYKKEKTKVAGTNAGGSSSFELGGRYSDKLSQAQAWYGEGKILLNSYESGTGKKAPDNYTGLSVRGGIRYLFPDFHEKLVPYIAGAAGYEANKTVESSATMDIEYENSGVIYAGLVGFQMDMDRDFFIALESELFKSFLFATEKTTTTDYSAPPAVTSSKSETTRTELYVRSNGAFDLTQIIVGMRF